VAFATPFTLADPIMPRGDIFEYLGDQCREICITNMKEEDICHRFCSFVDDIVKEHTDEMVRVLDMAGKEPLVRPSGTFTTPQPPSNSTKAMGNGRHY
jgi:hypothetical protein